MAVLRSETSSIIESQAQKKVELDENIWNSKKKRRDTEISGKSEEKRSGGKEWTHVESSGLSRFGHLGLRAPHNGSRFSSDLAMQRRHADSLELCTFQASFL